MKRTFIFLLTLMMLLNSTSLCIANPEPQATTAPPAVSISLPELAAKSAVLINQDTGRILFDKNAYQKQYPASITKIMTALLALQNENLDSIITVGKEVDLAPMDGSRAGLKPGQKISLRDLLRALLLPSGNDAAYTVSVHIARKVANNQSMNIDASVDYFVSLMNNKVNELGLTNTHFINPDGYPDENHYTTAYDLALISREAMQNPFFREVVKTQSYTFKTDENKETTWPNRNLLIRSKSKYYLPEATGIKTGHTSVAGYCLISSATKNNMNLIAVVLNSSEPGRWIDSKKLLEYGFMNFQSYQLLKKNQAVKTIRLKNQSLFDPGQLDLIPAKDFTEILRKDEVPKMLQTITWNKELLAPPLQPGSEERLLAPLHEGQTVGKVVIQVDGETIAESELLAARTVKQNIISLITSKKVIPYTIAAGLVILVVAILAFRQIISKKKQKY